LAKIKESDSPNLDILTLPESIEDIYPEAVSHFLEYLFLRKRSMRYNSVAVEEGSELKQKVPFATFRPVLKTESEVGSLESLMFSFLKSSCSKIISEKEQFRTTEFKNK
jgi:hypothetical protein